MLKQKTEETFNASKHTVLRVWDFRRRLSAVISTGENTCGELVDKTREAFVAKMNDDLNSPQGVAVLFDLINEVEGMMSSGSLNHESANAVNLFLAEIDEVLGMMTLSEKDATLTTELKKLITEREEARSAKNWLRADEIRDQLLEQGVGLKDGPEGVFWYYV